MFEESTIQTLTTVVLSATATFMLAFTIRLISGSLHPQLRNCEGDTGEFDQDGFQPLSSTSPNHRFVSSSGSSKKSILTTHQGQCRCSRVRFHIRAPSELHAIVTDDEHVSLFPRILVTSEEFMWQADAQALRMIATGGKLGDATTSGAHFLCSECGVEVAFAPSVTNKPQKAAEERTSMILQVNLDCLDMSHITCIHHHHVSTVPSTPKPQTFLQRFQLLQNQFHHQQQQIEHSTASKFISNQNIKNSLGQIHSHYPVHSDPQRLPEEFPRVYELGGEGDDEDEDDEDDGGEISQQNQHFALNMQLNSLGHYSRNRLSNASSVNSGRFRNYGSTPTNGNLHLSHPQSNQYNKAFFSNQSSPSQDQFGSIQQHRQQQITQDGSAPDSDTTEELFFEQFYAPASPFSPPITATAASARANSHFRFHPASRNPSKFNTTQDQSTLDNSPVVQQDVSNRYVSQLQCILGADSSMTPEAEPQVFQTPPRATPNKTHRVVHSIDHRSSHPSLRLHTRGGTPTSIDSTSSHSQTNNRSHSGTSSPASIVSNSAGSLGTAGSFPHRFHNYNPNADFPSQAEPSGSEVAESVWRRGRSLFFANNNASTFLVSDVLRDEYGNELDLATLLDSGDTDHLDDMTSHSEQSSVQTLQTLRTQILKVAPDVAPITEDVSSSVWEADGASDSVRLQHSQVNEGDMSASLGAEVDEEGNPGNLWQRRHVTVRKSTPGQLQIQHQRGSHYRYQSAQYSAGRKRSSARGGNTANPDDASLDFPMYQNLKRYLDRHLSPSLARNSKSGTET